jgi:hypothetical protein
MARKPSTRKTNKRAKADAAPQLQAETEPMEVHHQPEVEKKGIKVYLLEGLMIF